MKPLHWHPRAYVDIDDAAAWYARQGGVALELAFVAALESATKHIARHPGIGSNRHAGLLKLQGLQSWPVKGFPHLVFYFEREAHVDVWRLLHAQRDIPAWMAAPDGTPYDGSPSP